MGKPDLVFASARVVVFIDGDFWHGRWLDQRIERGDFKSNADYWIPKLRRNIARDLAVTDQLKAEGWLVLRVWESDVKKDTEGIANLVAQSVWERRTLSKKHHQSKKQQIKNARRLAPAAAT